MDESMDVIDFSRINHNNNILTSTPKGIRKKPSKFKCTVCLKTYEKKFYFDKHVASHSSDQAPAAGKTANAPRQLDFNDSNISNSSSTVFQVPKAPAPTNKRKANGGKASTSKKEKKQCTWCLKVYVDTKAFKNHMRCHTLEVAASRFPDGKNVEENSCDIGVSALTRTANGFTFGESLFPSLVGYVVSLSHGTRDPPSDNSSQNVTTDWENFCGSVCKQLTRGFPSASKFVLPSALATHIIKEQERLMSDVLLCEAILKNLKLEAIFNQECRMQFMLQFSLSYVIEILHYISTTFAQNLPRRYVKTIGEPDKQDRQVIYYVAGSVVRRFFNRAYQYSGSGTWQTVKTVLKTKVLQDKAEADQDPVWIEVDFSLSLQLVRVSLLS